MQPLAKQGCLMLMIPLGKDQLLLLVTFLNFLLSLYFGVLARTVRFVCGLE